LLFISGFVILSTLIPVRRFELTATAHTIPRQRKRQLPKEGGVSKVRLRRFLAALREHPGAAAEIPDGTWKRWISAQFPANIQWLLRSPEVMRALADDAEEWTPEEWAEIEATTSKRAASQKAYREGERRPRGRPRKDATPKGRKR
jgi:hypothetical protein